MGDSSLDVPFGTIWRDAQAMAPRLLALAPQGTIAGVMSPSPACLTTLLGAWVAGLTFASLPTISRGMARGDYARRVRALLDLVGATHLLVDSVGRAHEFGPGVEVLRYDAPRGSQRGAIRFSDDAALVQFSSGTTDEPTGIEIDMANLSSNIRAICERVEYASEDVVVSWLPLSHDMGLIGMCLAPLAAMSASRGGIASMWLMTPEHFVRDPLAWIALMSEVGGTVTCAPNFALELTARRISAIAALSLARLRCLLTGAETVRPSTLNAFSAATEGMNFRAQALTPAYGLAEATLAVTISEPSEHWRTTRRDGVDYVSLGRPVRDMELRSVPGGSRVGELQIRGSAVSRRALGRHGWTREHDEWLATRDHGFLQDGELHFVRRRSDWLVVRGRNLHAPDLEHAAGAVPGVRGGAVAAIADDDGLVLVIEPSSTTTGGAYRAICNAVARRVGELCGVRPSQVVVLAPGRLPKTPSGKLQRGLVLQALADEPAVLHRSRR